MNEFKVGDCLYNPKRGSMYIVVSCSEYNSEMSKVFGDCMFTLDGVFLPLLALTEVRGFHLPGEYISIVKHRINNPRYGSDLDNTYEKIEI